MTDASPHGPLTREAIAWVVRVGDDAFADWNAFTAWLEVSPAHADAYYAAAAAEAEMVAVLAQAPKPMTAPASAPVPFTAISQARQPRRWPRWAGAALAASLVGVMAIRFWPMTPAPQVYETAAGTRRTIALADGSTVILNGATRLEIDGRDARSLTLAHGEALFSVRHDDAHPFRVRVGDADVVDVGTRFDVVRDGKATRVAVAEGAVDWHSGGGEPVRVDAGHGLRARDGSGEVQLGALSSPAVGGWAQGQLDYDGVALSEVAADLSRTLGVRLVLDPSVARRTVRGVVRLDGGADAVVPRLAAIAGIRARRDGEQWRLTGSP